MYTERFADRTFGRDDVADVVDRDPLDISGSLQQRKHLADIDRISLGVRVPPERGGGGDLPHQRGRCHLPGGHPVNRVVDEDRGDLFPSGSSVYDLGRTDRRKISVPLVAENSAVGMDPFDSGRHGRRATVGRLCHIAGKIQIIVVRAADRRDADRFV